MSNTLNSLYDVCCTIVFPTEYNLLMEEDIILLEIFHDFLPKVLRFSSSITMNFKGRVYESFPLEVHTVVVDGVEWSRVGLNLRFSNVPLSRLYFVDLSKDWKSVTRVINSQTQKEKSIYNFDLECYYTACDFI